MWLCALLLFVQAGTPPPDLARQHAARGYELARKGELKASETELREAVRLAPSDAVNVALLGAVLSAQEKLAEASTWFERALAIDPNDTGTRFNLANTQFRLGQLEAAKKNLRWILKQKPDHPQARALLARIQAGGGFDAALGAYQSGRFADSQALLERLTSQGARDPRVFNLLAWCHHRQGRSEEALAAAHKAIELAPNDATWYSNAAQILIEDGMLEAAWGAAAKALSLDPNSALALKIQGLVSMKRGAFKPALDAFRRAAELNKQDPEAVQWFGTAQQMLYQYREARSTFEQGIARFPNHAPMYLAYGKLLLAEDPQNGAPRAQAIRLFNKALALDATLPDAHYELGKLLLDTGKPSEALPHLEAAAKLDPHSSRTHLALAGAYRALGRMEDQARELGIYRATNTNEAGQK
ncbi:MAG TPA: tetratricopeptide repeat protein [Bryobacteraceae bacterium]